MILPNHYRVLLAVLIALAALQWLHTSTDLAFDRLTIEGGAYWRLITGQLVHTNLIHFVMNALALAILWELMRRDFSALALVSLLALLAPACGILLYLFEPQLFHYVGLSGVLHGLLVAGAGRLCARGNALGWLLLALIAVKLVVENVFPGSLEGTAELIGQRVATESHRWGAAAGAVLGAALYLQGRHSAARKLPG